MRLVPETEQDTQLVAADSGSIWHVLSQLSQHCLNSMLSLQQASHVEDL